MYNWKYSWATPNSHTSLSVWVQCPFVQLLASVMSLLFTFNEYTFATYDNLCSVLDCVCWKTTFSVTLFSEPVFTYPTCFFILKTTYDITLTNEVITPKNAAQTWNVIAGEVEYISSDDVMKCHFLLWSPWTVSRV